MPSPRVSTWSSWRRRRTTLFSPPNPSSTWPSWRRRRTTCVLPAFFDKILVEKKENNMSPGRFPLQGACGEEGEQQLSSAPASPMTLVEKKENNKLSWPPCSTSPLWRRRRTTCVLHDLLSRVDFVGGRAEHVSSTTSSTWPLSRKIFTSFALRGAFDNLLDWSRHLNPSQHAPTQMNCGGRRPSVAGDKTYPVPS